jgi:hypothetical protein
MSRLLRDQVHWALVRRYRFLKTCTPVDAYISILSHESRVTLNGIGENRGGEFPITQICLREMWVFSVPFEATSSELNVCPKGYQ